MVVGSTSDSPLYVPLDSIANPLHARPWFSNLASEQIGYGTQLVVGSTSNPLLCWCDTEPCPGPESLRVQANRRPWVVLEKILMSQGEDAHDWSPDRAVSGPYMWPLNSANHLSPSPELAQPLPGPTAFLITENASVGGVTPKPPDPSERHRECPQGNLSRL